MFSHDQLVAVLRAMAEPTRVRLTVLLAETELTVSEMITVLGQSQPRVSRHLKLMADVGVLFRNREGTRAFYRLSHRDEVKSLVAALMDTLDPNDPIYAADRAVLAQIRQERARLAETYFAQSAARWDEIRSLHLSEDEVESALLNFIETDDLGQVLDIGTGTGRMLQVLNDRFDNAVGLDNSAEMLAVARAKVALSGVEWRQGSLFDAQSLAEQFDFAIMHMVLHFMENPVEALKGATSFLKPGGKLLLVDFAPHEFEFLRSEHNHLRNGFSHHEMHLLANEAGLEVLKTQDLQPDLNTETVSDADMKKFQGEGLTVTFWLLSASE